MLMTDSAVEYEKGLMKLFRALVSGEITTPEFYRLERRLYDSF